MANIQITGVEQALANLAQLPRKVAFKHLRIALSAAGGTIKQGLMAAVQSNTGLLRKSQTVKKPVIPDASWDIKHHGKPAYVMIGTKRHVIKYRGKKHKLLSTKKARDQFRSGKKPPAQIPSYYVFKAEKKSHFIERTARGAGPQAIARAAQKLAAAFETEAAALPK